MTLAASAQGNVFGSYVQSNYSSSQLLYAIHKPSTYRSSLVYFRKLMRASEALEFYFIFL